MKLKLDPKSVSFICKDSFCKILKDGESIGSRSIDLTDDEISSIKLILKSAVVRNEKKIN